MKIICKKSFIIFLCLLTFSSHGLCDEEASNFEKQLAADIKANGWKKWDEMKKWKSVSRIERLGNQRWQDLLTAHSNPITRFVAYKLISSDNPELRAGAALVLLSEYESAVNSLFSNEASNHLKELLPNPRNIDLFTTILLNCDDGKNRIAVGSFLHDVPSEFLIAWFAKSENTILHSSGRGLVVSQLLSRERNGETLPVDVSRKLLQTLYSFRKCNGFGLAVFLIYSEERKQDFDITFGNLVDDKSVTDDEFMLVIAENQNELKTFISLSERTYESSTANRRKEQIQAAIERIQHKEGSK